MAERERITAEQALQAVHLLDGRRGDEMKPKVCLLNFISQSAADAAELFRLRVEVEELRRRDPERLCSNPSCGLPWYRHYRECSTPKGLCAGNTWYPLYCVETTPFASPPRFKEP